MSFQDVANNQGTSKRATRSSPKIGIEQMVMNARRLVQQIDAQAAAMKNSLDSSKDKLDSERLKGQVQEAFKMGNQAAIFLKEARDIDPNHVEAAHLRTQLTAALANLRNVHNVALSREKKASAEAKMAINRARQEVSDDHNLSDSEATENEALMEAHRRRMKQMAIQSEIATNEAIIAERETSIQDIEVALTEISKIMKDMSQDIQKQGEQLEYIEDHIEQTLAHTKAGTAEVKKAMKHQKASRKRMCCLLFFVLGIIAAIVVYFSLFYN